MDIRRFFFRYRSYTPIPLVLLLLYFAQPSWPGLLWGLPLILLGEALRIHANRYAGGATRTTKVGAAALVTTGPFAHLRNPLYIGNMLIYTGVVLVAGAPSLPVMLLVTWAFFIVQYALIISLEEETLTEKFGTEYREYCAHVPRLWPRLTPWNGSHRHTPRSLVATLRIERSTLLNIAVLLVLIALRALLA